MIHFQRKSKSTITVLKIGDHLKKFILQTSSSVSKLQRRVDCYPGSIWLEGRSKRGCLHSTKFFVFYLESWASKGPSNVGKLIFGRINCLTWLIPAQIMNVCHESTNNWIESFKCLFVTHLLNWCKDTTAKGKLEPFLNVSLKNIQKQKRMLVKHDSWSHSVPSS